MKETLVLCALLLVAVCAKAQEAPTNGSSGEKAAANSEARIQTLEQQVSMLAEQVALLRGQLKVLADAKAPREEAAARLVLTSASAPAPAPATAESSSLSVASAAALPAAAPPAPALQAQALQSTQTQTFGGASGNARLLNPDISLIGDFIGAVGHNDVVQTPSLQLHESELGVQAIIDPYARADVFISFGEQGVNVEEGYVTFTSLPAGLLLKVGKMRANFGKINTIHNHALPFIDRPLATNNLVGGEDGIDDAGFSLSRILPAPKGWFVEATGQVFRGDSADVFKASERQDASVVGHLRGYKDITESTNLDLGLSYARGHNDVGSPFITSLYGADATLRWKPLRRAIYKSFIFRTELFYSLRDQISPLDLSQSVHAFGTYSSAEYRVNRRWTVGGRFDRSAHARNANLIDTGLSAIVTYWPSEFSQIRGQYRYGHLATAPNASFDNANELLFQFLFVMGAHGAHPF
ncbi:MAG TPA: hypothetical protein VN974_08550 [Candidatus Dormibacteraeota bacterium]|nr:hypothetical protein [Candidatus Dormibacteraeota bacterium]